MKSRDPVVTAEEMMRGVLLAVLTGTHLLSACADAPVAKVTRSGESVRSEAAAVTAGSSAGRNTAGDGVPLTIEAEVGGGRYTGTGAGGSIVVDGIDASGTPVRLTVTCGTFVRNTEQNG